MKPLPFAEAHRRYSASVVPDAGASQLRHQPHGHPNEVYECPQHSGASCGFCGGSGYRAVCNSTACHEYGCQNGTCARTEADFLGSHRSS